MVVRVCVHAHMRARVMLSVARPYARMRARKYARTCPRAYVRTYLWMRRSRRPTRVSSSTCATCFRFMVHTVVNLRARTYVRTYVSTYVRMHHRGHSTRAVCTQRARAYTCVLTRMTPHSSFLHEHPCPIARLYASPARMYVRTFPGRAIAAGAHACPPLALPANNVCARWATHTSRLHVYVRT